MKLFSHKMFGFALLLSLLAFISCQTEMELTESIDSYQFEESYKTPNMEFIGFKAGDAQWGNSSRTDWGQIKNTQSIRSVGSALQFGGIAVDESSSYFGVYSFQEIKEYKNKKRYITFIEIPDFDLTYTTNEMDGARIAGIVFCSTGVGLPIGLLLIAHPYKTTMYMKTNANIYVYDAQIKEIIYKKNVSSTAEKEFKGIWYRSSEIGKQKIYDYFASIMANELLKEYDNVKKSPQFKDTLY
ncbi:hypothetical protein [Treponema sp. UBA3813]|uniref:hypothetical protein n=1 Tax=Treponema sp. UBA3813 TaxID=1947715 RepID=UPI0025F4E29B|nr:hypothetical protein [Treponema sp. UBA3813]